MLGIKLKELRELNGFVQRQIAALLEIEKQLSNEKTEALPPVRGGEETGDTQGGGEVQPKEGEKFTPPGAKVELTFKSGAWYNPKRKLGPNQQVEANKAWTNKPVESPQEITQTPEIPLAEGEKITESAQEVEQPIQPAPEEEKREEKNPSPGAVLESKTQSGRPIEYRFTSEQGWVFKDSKGNFVAETPKTQERLNEEWRGTQGKSLPDKIRDAKIDTKDEQKSKKHHAHLGFVQKTTKQALLTLSTR
jgi:hypothetical protein